MGPVALHGGELLHIRKVSVSAKACVAARNQARMMRNQTQVMRNLVWVVQCLPQGWYKLHSLCTPQMVPFPAPHPVSLKSEMEMEMKTCLQMFVLLDQCRRIRKAIRLLSAVSVP